MIPSFSVVALVTIAWTWRKWVSAFAGVPPPLASVRIPPYSGALTILPVAGSRTISFSIAIAAEEFVDG